MGKRGALRQLLISLQRRRYPVAAPSPAPRRSTLETLESRQLLTAAANPVVDAVWLGHDIKVFQNEYVVELKGPANIDRIAAKMGFSDVESLGGYGYFTFQSTRPLDQLTAWAKGANKAIASFAPNIVVTPADVNLPNDPLLPLQWQHNNTGQVVPDSHYDPDGSIGNYFGTQAGTPGSDIDAARAWDIVKGDPNSADPNKQIVVAVIDTGIDLVHPDLVNNIWTNTKEIPGDGIDNDGNGYIDDVHGYDFVDGDSDPSDEFGHGTHVAGIIGAQGNNGTGVTGVIQNVKLMALKVLNRDGFGSVSQFIQAIQYATAMKNSGINVVAANASLHYFEPFANPVFHDAVARFGEAGSLLVVAAGNESLDLDSNAEPGPFPGKFSLSEPNVITVAATDNRDNIAFFSNIGATSVQLAAPGLNIMSTLPSYPYGPMSETGVIQQSGLNDYGYDSGTSMASPMVAGAAALLKAAKPDASMAEIKNALLQGADFIPALASQTSSSPLVHTAGRLNVYRSIQILLNQRVNIDTVTRGNWVGAYGSQGSVVYGGPQTFPSFVNATVTGGSLQIVADSSKDVDALQKTLSPTDRIAAQLSSSTNITLDLEFTDGLAHKVSLYQANLDSSKKAHSAQDIWVIDPSDPSVPLAVWRTGDLATGEYDTFEINPPSSNTGQPFRIRLVIKPIDGVSTNAVLNGIFFDPATTGDATLVGVSNATGGNWRQEFGSQGAQVFGGNTTGNLVDHTTLTDSGTGGAVTIVPLKKKFARNAAALDNPGIAADKNRKVPAYAATTTSMDLVVDLSADTNIHRLTVYAADLEKAGRAQRLDLFDANSGALLSSVTLSDFAAGKYVTWNVTGKVRIHVTRLAGPTAVLGGVFVDAGRGAPIAYIGQDSITSGNWRSVYGADGRLIFGAPEAPILQNTFNTILTTGYSDPQLNSSTPTVSTTITGAYSEKPFTVTSRDKRYPLTTTPASNLRIANAKSTTGTMTVDLSFNNQAIHRVSLYMVDPDRKAVRAQRVDIVSVAGDGTETVIASELVTNFGKGKYLTFDVRQADPAATVDVRVKITRVQGRTAVLNGIFFG